MKAIMLTEFRRYRLIMALILGAAAVNWGLYAMFVSEPAYRQSVLLSYYVIALLVAFAAGRLYDGQSELLFLSVWPLSRHRLFFARLLSHLLLAALTITALYLIAQLDLTLLSSSPGSQLGSGLSLISARALAILALVFALSAFWSQLMAPMLALLMTFISVVAIGYWPFAEMVVEWGGRLDDAYAKEAAVWLQRHSLSSLVMLAAAAFMLFTAWVAFVRDPVMELARRGIRGHGTVWIFLVTIMLLQSLYHTNWLGMSETRYRALLIGMRKPEVRRIMGQPQGLYPRWKGNLAAQITPPANGNEQPPQGQEWARAQADEVWRWWFPLDQKIGVVFDIDGRVIFKWVDY